MYLWGYQGKSYKIVCFSVLWLSWRIVFTVHGPFLLVIFCSIFIKLSKLWKRKHLKLISFKKKKTTQCCQILKLHQYDQFDGKKPSKIYCTNLKLLVHVYYYNNISLHAKGINIKGCMMMMMMINLSFVQLTKRLNSIYWGL